MHFLSSIPHNMLVDGLESCGLLVDYYYIFISWLDSHSDGTHSLQWWASDVMLIFLKLVPMKKQNVSGYVCNHGSPSGERDTASPRGRYGERLSVTRVWRYIFKNTTCWPARAHDVTTGVPQYKCRREITSSASSSEACVRSMAQSLGDAVSRSPLREPWLHT